MARTILKFKNRKIEGTYFQLPHAIVDSENWCNASPQAIKLLMYLARCFNGRNNGDLSAPFSTMKKRGWASPNTLSIALKELQHYGLIEMTRHGDLTGKCSLFALTWLKINYLGHKLELCNPTEVASGKWKHPVAKFDRKLAPKGYCKRIKKNKS